MNNKIGVMQGRLLPKYLGRYQAHPVGYWMDEFKIAKEINLDCIEFILDFNEVEKNPLLTDSGVNTIMNLTKETGILVRSVCADYFMEAPLHSKDLRVSNKSLFVLKKLIENASKIGVQDIVIPCVDHAALKSQSDVNLFIKQIKKILKTVENLDINLSLETDLDPINFSTLLSNLDSTNITVNYDIGNSAAMGYDCIEELKAYGSKISDVHIKDRSFNGGSVFLGEGDANFHEFFSALKNYNYQGPFIMQAYRDDEGLDIFKHQFQWIKPYLIDF